LKPIVIITAPVHQHLINYLTNKNWKVVYEPAITYQQLLTEIPTATGLVVTTQIKVDKTVIDAGKNLSWIARLGSGMELIDVDYATLKNITCVSSPEGNANAVAEHCLGLLLNLSNNITKSNNEVKNNIWLRNENRGFEITGKKIGIIGYGNTGEAFAKVLEGFSATILAFDKYKKNYTLNSNVIESNLETICNECDVISLHLPLTAETKFLANAYFFNALQKSPIFLSTCRGNITNTTELINALKNKKISGAGLDVIENEKINNLTPAQQNEFDWLNQQTNVVITPHIAGYTKEAYLKMTEVIIKKLNL
jgi:D-3-phosphoglycerate dehydrogenase / 2-oxoglutarate reductase